MENNEFIDLPMNLKLIVALELRDKYGIDKWKDKGGILGCRFTKEELLKIEELEFKNLGSAQLIGIDKLPNLRKLSIVSTTDDKFTVPRKLASIDERDLSYIADCKNLESLTIVNQTKITGIDLSRLSKLKELNISKNTNLVSIYGIGELTSLSSLTCYGNMSLQNIDGLDKVIVQNKDNLTEMNLDVMLFPKAIGYKHYTGSYNQEAMNTIEHINGGVIGSKVDFAGDKADEKVKWIETFTSQEDIKIGTHSMLKMHNKACQILHDIMPQNSSVAATIVAVEQYLAQNVTYNNESLKHEKTITALTSTGSTGVRVQLSHKHGVNGAYDCLVHGSCVCQGYTRGEQYILGLRGIKTREVFCNARPDTIGLSDAQNADNEYFIPSLPENGYHSIIRIDGYFNLYSDPCWNAGRYQLGDKSMPYTLLTKEEISKSHTLSFQEVNVDNSMHSIKRSLIAKSLESNALFQNSRTSEMAAQRSALGQNVVGIVRGADGRAY